jgi:hypothetical protein
LIRRYGRASYCPLEGWTINSGLIVKAPRSEGDEGSGSSL